MTAELLRLAIAVVRGWTRAYTWGMPALLAESRRAEIESDLWELQHDPDGRRGFAPAVQVFARLMAGAADDLYWRLEHAAIEDNLLLRRTCALTLAAAFVFVVLWILPGILRQPVEPHGRTAACASALMPAESTAEFRLQVINCAGAFFSARASTPSSPSRRD